MLSRYDRLKKYMAEDGIDVAVIISPANTIYFSANADDHAYNMQLAGLTE